MRPSASGRLVFEAEHVSKSFGGDPGRARLHAAHPARRSHRPHRSERIRQDDAAQAAGRRARARRGHDRARRPGADRLLRSAARASSIRSSRSPTASTTATTRSSINGQPRHVIGYLADFLFPRERAVSPVKSLSGGERNRLMLARLFARPANVLVMDEPTNDLDIETLELLEELIADFPGTVLLVSHDRAFLDNIVTSTLAFEGDGRVVEYVGGWADYLRQRTAAPAARGCAKRARRCTSPSARRERRAVPRRRSTQTVLQGAAGVRVAARADRSARGRAAAAEGGVGVGGVLQGRRRSHPRRPGPPRAERRGARSRAGALARARRALGTLDLELRRRDDSSHQARRGRRGSSAPASRFAARQNAPPRAVLTLPAAAKMIRATAGIGWTVGPLDGWWRNHAAAAGDRCGTFCGILKRAAQGRQDPTSRGGPAIHRRTHIDRREGRGVSQSGAVAARASRADLERRDAQSRKMLPQRCERRRR